MNRFYWSAICNKERLISISEIGAIIDKHGIILNFQRFSDISISFIIETDDDKAINLYNSLSEKVKIKESANDLINITSGCIILLDVVFTNSTGDLEIEVPDIPD